RVRPHEHLVLEYSPGDSRAKWSDLIGKLPSESVPLQMQSAVISNKNAIFDRIHTHRSLYACYMLGVCTKYYLEPVAPVAQLVTSTPSDGWVAGSRSRRNMLYFFSQNA
ncbi:unnamed protein product, partial [Sphacelaria rigidula]